MLLNALDLLKAHQKELSFNLKIVLDSEEEKAVSLPKAVKEMESVKADFLVIADGPMHASGSHTNLRMQRNNYYEFNYPRTLCTSA